MTNRLELNWKVDGFIDEQRYYCSETPIDPENLPTPTAVLPGDVFTYTDSSQREMGKKYHVRISAVKNSVEKISDEKVVIFGKLWTPQNLTNTAKLWFNAESVIVDSFNRISQVTNLASNNYHFTQANNTNKAIKQFDGLIGHNAMKFDGVNDYYTNQAANALSANVNKLWSFAVHKRDTIDANTHTIFGFIVGGAGRSAGRFRHYATTTEFVNNVGVGSRRLDDDSFITLYETENKGEDWVVSLVYRDYSIAKTLVSVNANDYTATGGSMGNTQNTTANNAWIGAEGASAGFMNGSIAELLVGNTALTQADIDKLFGYAAHKYGLQNNLSVGHPYKEVVPTVED